jgi:hypothetical protein
LRRSFRTSGEGFDGRIVDLASKEIIKAQEHLKGGEILGGTGKRQETRADSMSLTLSSDVQAGTTLFRICLTPKRYPCPDLFCGISPVSFRRDQEGSI